MGIFNFVRPRKEVTASRATTSGRPAPAGYYSNGPTPLSKTPTPGPIDRGNSPLADEPRTEAWGAKMAGIHNTSGFIGSDGKRY